MVPTDHEPTLYTDLAAEYDRIYGEKDYAGEVEFVLDRYAEANGQPPDRALIVGCGTGGHARHLTAAGVDVVGIDPNPAMLAVARETVPAARFHRGRLPTITTETTEPFDLCWVPFTVINYLEPTELVPAIETLTAQLDPPGLLVVDNGHFPVDVDIGFDLIDGREGGCCRFYGFERVDETHVRMVLLFVLPPDRIVADAHTLTTFADSTVQTAVSTAGFSVDRYGWYVDTPPAVDGPSVFVGKH